MGVFYFVFFGVSTNRNNLDLENVLNQDVLEEIKQEIEFKEDSIRRVEDEENLKSID